MSKIITPRPRKDPPTFGITVKIAHPKGEAEGARRQARLQALSMLEDVVGWDEPVTIWFSAPAIEGVAPDGKETATVYMSIVGNGAERKFKERAERAKAARQ